MSDCVTPRTVARQVLCPWDFPGKNTGVVAISFSRESSQPRNRTQVSHIASRLFTIWATREDLGNENKSSLRALGCCYKDGEGGGSWIYCLNVPLLSGHDCGQDSAVVWSSHWRTEYEGRQFSVLLLRGAVERGWGQACCSENKILPEPTTLFLIFN